MLLRYPGKIKWALHIPYQGCFTKFSWLHIIIHIILGILFSYLFFKKGYIFLRYKWPNCSGLVGTTYLPYIHYIVWLSKNSDCIEKFSITLPKILPTLKDAKYMRFHYGLIFKRTYFSHILMNNVESWRTTLSFMHQRMKRNCPFLWLLVPNSLINIFLLEHMACASAVPCRQCCNY